MHLGVRFLWLLAGLLALALGVIGVVLPILPTTPFLLIAAFAFAQSSQRMHRWLLAHRLFGPLINNWHKYGSIDRTSKRTAIAIIVVTPILTWFIGAPLWALACQLIVLTIAAAFIISRPLPPA
jgi:uncharacterized membrane protein YbaN (DUF454 family)